MSASLLGGVRASYSLESPIQNFWESKILLESQLVTSLSIQVSCKLKVIAVFQLNLKKFNFRKNNMMR